jgi:hypothetical protein
MSHLTLEALARLVDEAPAGEEASHLAGCSRCQAELEAMREDRHALAMLPDLVPPPDAWPAIRRSLAREGLVRPRPAKAVGLRVAAAVVLFAAGGAVGWTVRGTGDGAVPRATPGMATELPDAASLAATAGEAGPGEGSLAGDPLFAALDRFMADAAPAPAPANAAARLAALDNIVLTTAEALQEAPADPVIQSYHRTALAQRDAVLRQIQAAAGRPVF